MQWKVVIPIHNVVVGNARDKININRAARLVKIPVSVAPILAGTRLFRKAEVVPIVHKKSLLSMPSVLLWPVLATRRYAHKPAVLAKSMKRKNDSSVVTSHAYCASNFAMYEI